MGIADGLKIPGYPHFDSPLGADEARRLTGDPETVAQHTFFPLLRRTIVRNKFRLPNGSRKGKPRDICYAAKRDSVIFRAYRDKLAQSYELLLEDAGLQNVVIAYRPVKSSQGRRMSTIHFAVDAFEFIRSSKSATVFCLDISRFFDTIAHSSIIGAWKLLISCDRLPADHFAVLKAATKYHFVDEKLVFEALGYFGSKSMPDGTKRPAYVMPRRSIPTQLCSLPEFVEKIVPLVKMHVGTQGVAQGIPIADVLANASLFRFDVDMQRHAAAVGGYYRRYSDDILFVVPDATCDVQQWMSIIADCLKGASSTLELSTTKNAVIRVTDLGGSLELRSEPGLKQLPAIEYLGLTFNGSKVALRQSTVSRLNRRIVRRVRKHVCSLKRDFPAESRVQIEGRLRLGGIMRDFGRLDHRARQGPRRKTNFRIYAVSVEDFAGLDLTAVLKQLSKQKEFIRKRASIELDRAFRP